MWLLLPLPVWKCCHISFITVWSCVAFVKQHNLFIPIILKWIINQRRNMVSMAFLIRLYGWLLWTWYWMLGFQNDSGFFDQVRDCNLTVYSVGGNVLCTRYIVEYMKCCIDYILNICICMDVKLSSSSRWVRASLLYDKKADTVPVLHV